MRSQCSENSAEGAPRNTVGTYTVTTGASGLAGRRYTLADVAHLVRDFCEWYLFVLRGEWARYRKDQALKLKIHGYPINSVPPTDSNAKNYGNTRNF
eukprot:2346881-Rhodomonas_salina.1